MLCGIIGANKKAMAYGTMLLIVDNYSFLFPDHSQDRSTELEVVQNLKDRVRKLSGELANVHFSYRDPERNFDRSKVKGVVARLIRIKDSSAATALEVCISKCSLCRFELIFAPKDLIYPS